MGPKGTSSEWLKPVKRGSSQSSAVRRYEYVFLARQDLAPAQVDALAESATKIIEDHGGKVVRTETWGLRNIAYRVQKNRKAHYVALGFEAPAPVVAELERQTQINESVIRYMTVSRDRPDLGRTGGLQEHQQADRDLFSLIRERSLASVVPEPDFFRETLDLPRAETPTDRLTVGALGGSAAGAVIGFMIVPGLGGLIGAFLGAAIGAAGIPALTSNR